MRMGATHAIQKFQEKFQNHIPRELAKNFGIVRVTQVPFSFRNEKKSTEEKNKPILNPGMQPNYGLGISKMVAGDPETSTLAQR